MGKLHPGFLSRTPSGAGAGLLTGLNGVRDRASDLKFISQWLRAPRHTGAIAASGPGLARTMAEKLDPCLPGDVIEFGPGTGPVTRALIERGFSPERLILIEMNRDFRDHLETAFPGVRVIDGDAFKVRQLAEEHDLGTLNGVISSLPLLNWTKKERVRLLSDVLGILPERRPFIQFTYGPTSPVPIDDPAIAVEKSSRIWLNLPPATVWTYRKR